MSACECYTDFALQEFIAGRLEFGVRNDLTGHLSTCTECRQALAAFEAEARLLRTALTPVSRPGSEEPVSDESLALFLAGALNESRASQLEAEFGRHPALLQRLLALQQEASITRAELDLRVSEIVQPEPMGLILRMPKRIQPAATILADRRSTG